jgi:hypothetical protein
MGLFTRRPMGLFTVHFADGTSQEFDEEQASFELEKKWGVLGVSLDRGDHITYYSPTAWLSVREH